MFKTKLKPDGSVEHFKACLVAKGYNQLEEVEFGVSKTKINPDRSVEYFKARVVSKGYNQLEGVYFDSTSSPIINSTTTCLVDCSYTEMAHQTT